MMTASIIDCFIIDVIVALRFVIMNVIVNIRSDEVIWVSIDTLMLTAEL